MKITAFITGLGIGVAVAMLFAPRSGKEMREVLCEKAEDGRRYAKGRLRHLRNVANVVADRGKEAINDQKDAVMAAVQVAKNTYHRESQMRVS
jgi:gas vesicle protein